MPESGLSSDFVGAPGDRRPRRLLAAASAAACAAGFLLVSAGTAGASNFTRYVDAAGDSLGAGGDITEIRVSNDDTGKISFLIATPNHPTLQVTENLVLYLDTDQNQSTGTAGYDNRLRVFGGSNPPIRLETWTGAAWLDRYTGSLKARFNRGLEASIHRSALCARPPSICAGGTSGFAFGVVTIDGRTGSISDKAPNGALTQRWRYRVVIGSDGSKPASSTTISPRFPRPSFSSGGSTTFTSFVVSRLPSGARVVLRYRGSTERLTANRAGKVSSRMLRRKFPGGAVIAVRVTKAGYRPYSGTVTILIRPPWIKVTRGR